MATIYNAKARVNSRSRFNLYNHSYDTLSFTAETNATLGHHIKNSPDPDHALCERLEAEQTLPEEATKNQPPDPAFIPFSDLSESFALEAKNNSNIKNMDESREKGKQYFEEFYSTRSTPWFFNVKMPWRHIFMINRMRANHTCLTELYQTQRKVLLERLKRIGLFPQLKVERLISRPNIETCIMLCHFFTGLGVRV
ncbi:hypothetical protein TKK_0018658 [Trichogramma kaykai]